MSSYQCRDSITEIILSHDSLFFIMEISIPGKTAFILRRDSRLLLMYMSTSWHGITSRITGPLWGESTGHRGIEMFNFDIFFICYLKKVIDVMTWNIFVHCWLVVTEIYRLQRDRNVEFWYVLYLLPQTSGWTNNYIAGNLKRSCDVIVMMYHLFYRDFGLSVSKTLLIW